MNDYILHPIVFRRMRRKQNVALLLYIRTLHKCILCVRGVFSASESITLWTCDKNPGTEIDQKHIDTKMPKVTVWEPVTAYVLSVHLDLCALKGLQSFHPEASSDWISLHLSDVSFECDVAPEAVMWGEGGRVEEREAGREEEWVMVTGESNYNPTV